MVPHHVIGNTFTSCVKLNAISAKCTTVVRLLGGLVVGVVGALIP